MKLSRGDVVVCSLQGDYGKPRPAVIVQSNLFNETHASIVICPITSHLIDAPLFRIKVEPKPSTGLKTKSQVMVDKIVAISREKISKNVGVLPSDVMSEVNAALALWIGT